MRQIVAMKRERERARRLNVGADAPAQSLFSAWSNAELSLSTAPAGRRSVQDVPTNLKDCLELVRRWTTPGPYGPPNAFVLTVLGLRQVFYDYGFELTAPVAWEKKQGLWFESYRNDCWAEWLKLDNVICLWRNGGRPLQVRPERCRYSNEFGIEKLEYEHRLTWEQIDAMKALTPAQRTLLKANTWLTLYKDDDSIFGFEVLTRAAVGEGLAWPGFQGTLIPASGFESLQVADAQLAAGLRRVYEQHKAGHETRYGPNAGGSGNFLKEIMKKAIEKGIKGKKGYTELVTRHDHLIEWPRPKPEVFAATRYEGMKAQLIDWSMPLGHMLFAKTLNPYLLLFLRYLAQGERARIEAHLTAVATRALGLTNPKMKWSNKCFNDSRLAFDMIKFGLASGPTSQETFLRDADQDPATERARKASEAALPDEQTQPLVVAQGSAVTDRAGRKTGSNDRKGT